MTDSPQSRYRLLYSVRIVLALLVLFVLVDMGIGLSIWLRYHREQQIVQKIESWRGGVSTGTGGPEWLKQFVGEDRMQAFGVFERVYGVELFAAEITDREIAHLSRGYFGGPLLPDVSRHDE